MAELVLRSSRTQILKPLVQAALHNERRLLEAGIERSHERLRKWETRFGFSTPEFVRRFENDELEETLEFAEWIGEHRLLERLEEKVLALREVEFAD